MSTSSPVGRQTHYVLNVKPDLLTMPQHEPPFEEPCIWYTAIFLSQHELRTAVLQLHRARLSGLHRFVHVRLFLVGTLTQTQQYQNRGDEILCLFPPPDIMAAAANNG